MGDIVPDLRDARGRAPKRLVRAEARGEAAQDAFETRRRALGQRKPGQERVEFGAHHLEVMLASLEPDLDRRQTGPVCGPRRFQRLEKQRLQRPEFALAQGGGVPLCGRRVGAGHLAKFLRTSGP